MPFDFGDVVLTPFPFTSQTASKQRPAVIAGNRRYNAAKPDAAVMAVTSQHRPGALGETAIAEWRAGRP